MGSFHHKMPNRQDSHLTRDNFKSYALSKLLTVQSNIKGVCMEQINFILELIISVPSSHIYCAKVITICDCILFQMARQ